MHRALGPGLLESTYEACLVYELINRGLKVEQQKSLPVVYKTVQLDCDYRLDLLVENAVVVATNGSLAIFQAQLLSYVKLSGCKAGLLINFNVKKLADGIQRLHGD